MGGLYGIWLGLFGDDNNRILEGLSVAMFSRKRGSFRPKGTKPLLIRNCLGPVGKGLSRL